MAPICANKSDRKSYMNEIDGFSVLLTFPKPKANRSRKRRQFDDFSLLQGVASLRPIHSYKTACTTTRICSMCFARKKMQSRVSGKIRNTVHPFVQTCKRSHLEKSDRAATERQKPIEKTLQERKLQKGARQLKSRKPLRKTQGQASFLDRRVRNMENRRGPLNRRIRRYSILQQLNFGDTSCVHVQGTTYNDIISVASKMCSYARNDIMSVASKMCSFARNDIISVASKMCSYARKDFISVASKMCSHARNDIISVASKMCSYARNDIISVASKMCSLQGTSSSPPHPTPTPTHPIVTTGERV